ncbi:hypothetical protein [Nakamurella sp.]|uniref:hypothetical protein n=1 Tax=Nakamurella sp. TaxID=1869182 RepID=UPI003B3B1FC7
MNHLSHLTTPTSGELRERWYEQSRAAGWAFVSDWHHPAVDALCEACLLGRNIWAPAERLGAVRAEQGVSLGETLADLDGLACLVPDVAEGVIQRAASLGWAERMTRPHLAVFDPLTGLVSVDYLRTRLGEVYQAADVDGAKVSTTHALVTVRLNLAGRAGWDRLTPLILAGDAMRSVFDGGHTLARLADHMAVILTDRAPTLGRRTQLLAELVAERLRRERRSSDAPARIWIERLPDHGRAATDLIEELAR